MSGMSESILTSEHSKDFDVYDRGQPTVCGNIDIP